jgi:cholesterol oxidase
MTSSVRFTEEMLGHITFGETDFARGAQPDRDGSAAFKFHLTIEVEDIERFSTDPLRAAAAKGWIHCDALGGRLPVAQGWFNLFVDVEPGVKHMLYRLWFYDGVGHPLTMTGFKLVSNDAGFDVWKDTTTLFTRAPSAGSALGALVKFGAVFVRQLADAYLRRRSRARVAA